MFSSLNLYDADRMSINFYPISLKKKTVPHDSYNTLFYIRHKF
jgi:hypothetical protein